MIFVATVFLWGAIWLHIWSRFHDPLHPLILLLPQFMFFYGWMPLQSSIDDERLFSQYVGGDFVYLYQGLTVLLVAALTWGVLRGSQGVTPANAAWVPLAIKNPAFVRNAAILLGCVAVGAFAYIVSLSGGFGVAYGQAYGGGWAGFGFGALQEMPNLGIIAAILVFLSRTGQRRMRPIDWAIVLFCVSPTLIHAGLGARRGPAFLALLTIGGGYVYFMRKRVSVLVLVGSGLAVGFLLLFLVANRSSIYLGSQEALSSDPLMILKSWNANEYLIGSATVRLTESEGGFWGARELVWIVCRAVPKGLWSDCYTALPAALNLDLNLWLNGGVDPLKVMAVAGWLPSVGSAEGYTASLWMEFQYLAPVASFLIGWLYGRCWEAARSSLQARVVYPLMAMLSIYLVAQSLDPWLYRLIMLGAPSYYLLGFVRASPATHDQPLYAPSMPAPP